ncbi:MAG: reverse transcriptase N-terminal domain-containing protein [Methanomassiliicoccaceae archaeon]|nr:reverse transcriptase N-terminal domain-containing protein [Methanomassiliicoccaceae archaeon]
MTARKSDSIASKIENLGDDPDRWETIDWKKAEAYVSRMQYRISKAQQKGDKNLVKRLQYLLAHSFYAKALAVKRVTTNQGKHTAGVDNELWMMPKVKMDAVKSLNVGRYRAKPLRRVHIPKRNGKLRPLSIPTMRDRARCRPCIRWRWILCRKRPPTRIRMDSGKAGAVRMRENSCSPC